MIGITQNVDLFEDLRTLPALIWCDIQSIMLNSFMDTLRTCRYSNTAHTMLEGLIYLQDIGFEILLGNHQSYWDHHGSSQLFHRNDKYLDIKEYI